MLSEINQKQLDNFLYNISWLRKHNGLSKKKMAEILEISVSTLNKIENGELPPRLGVGVVFNLHRHFGIIPKDQVGERLGD